MKTFDAPWGATLIISSLLGTALLFAVSVFCAHQVLTHGANRVLLLASAVPFLILFGCGLFTIRGYTLAPGMILIQRLLWQTRLSTGGLQSVTYEPNAMRWSIRTFGNGGLFSFSGAFWNRQLGAYRAFVTDPKRTVVLRYFHRTVVLSPSLPEQFVYELASKPA